MSETPKRKVYVNDGLTAEGVLRYQTAVRMGLCPAHGTKLEGRKRVWCGRGPGDCYTIFHDRFGQVKDWKRLREEALKRDGYKCVNCGAAQTRGLVSGYDYHTGATEVEVATGGARLEVDHIVEIRDGGPEFDLSNLRTLCHACHVTKTVARTRGWQAESTLRASVHKRPLEAFTLEGDRDPKEKSEPMSEEISTNRRIRNCQSTSSGELSFPPILQILDYIQRQRFTEFNNQRAERESPRVSRPRYLAYGPAAFITPISRKMHKYDRRQFSRDLSWDYMHWFYSQLDLFYVNSTEYRRCWINQGNRCRQNKNIRAASIRICLPQPAAT